MLGRYDDAEQELVQASERHEQMGAPIWLARTRLDIARLLLERGGEPARAARLLDQTLGTARDLGCGGIERQATRVARANRVRDGMKGPVAKGLAFGLEATSWALGGLAKVVAGAGHDQRDDRPAPRPGGTPATPAGGPEYVDYGALMTPPAPFTSMNTSLWGFWARADAERIAQLCDKVFAQPTGGAVRARPLSDYLMLTWGKIGKVVSQTPPYDQRGGVAEPQVAVWIPVALRDPGSRQERFAMFVPYLWLSNPMSLATGRELFGYPKSGGMPEFPDDGQSPQTWKLSVFGLDYSPGSVADWGHPLLEVTQNESAQDGAEAELDSLVDVARDAAGRLRDDSDVVGDFEIAESLL